MAEALLDNLMESFTGSRRDGFAIAPGIVKENLDALSLGRVKVSIPSRSSFEPWARLCAVGGSGSRGLIWVPEIDDEVLVAFAENDLGNVFILGGLWSMTKRPPLSLPTDFLTKKVLKTGAIEGLGHEIEFDDLKQSVSIKTSTEQKIVMDPQKIELSNLAGTVTITLDSVAQSIKISALTKISLEALAIEMKAMDINIKANATLTVGSIGPCTVTGIPIKLN
jgi:uncharacterized protein involved in type VI secretion and phage assembly